VDLSSKVVFGSIELSTYFFLKKFETEIAKNPVKLQIDAVFLKVRVSNL